MKPEELRIGNLIQDKKDREVTILKVAHLSEGLINYWRHDVYLPIPLTPEWLSEFGFKLITDDHPFENIKGDYWVNDCLILYSNGSPPENAYLVYYADHSFGKYQAVRGCWIYTVHDLQNTFYTFRGKELSVSNP